MIKGYPHLRLCIFALLFISNQLVAQNATRKTSFAQKDIMRSAVFLQNNQMVNDFNGSKILYFSRHDNVNAFFTAKGIIYKVNKIDQKELARRKRELKEKEKEKKKENESDEESLPLRTTTLTMQWLGANPNPKIEAIDKQEGYYSFLKKDNGAIKTLTTEGFKSITYKELYPGIDVVYSFSEKGGMEYYLVVRPHADVSKVKMAWTNAKSIKKDGNGNLLVHTGSGDIMESAPVSYTGNIKVASDFKIKNNVVQFDFPQGYSENEVLTIDPWVSVLTSLPPLNLGLDVDYDFFGNLFVYGAGAIDESDLTDFFEVTKYNSSGTPLWTFNGTVPAISWTTADLTDAIVVPGNFIVDKVSGKTYIGKTDLQGSSAVRINSAGAYDNFVSSINPFFQETWGFAYKCSDGSVLALGGGTSSELNMGIINTTTGATTTTNITGITSSYYQDILAGTYDTAGNLYVIMNSSSAPLPYT
ncbi:MAG: type sorting protein, partial [Bacteroidota bacterium]|nr:type sorting protein [Bacteroidota bacterium]